jgi:hypothetical protein
MSRVFVVLLLCLLTLPTAAQEVDCTVQVNIESVSTSNKDLLKNLAEDIRTYVNNFQWGPEKLDDKVKCTLDIFVKGVIGENRYSAQVFVGSARVVYGSNRSTAVLRLMDELWEFTYMQDRPISHNPYAFNDLTSFLDFYIYMILGHDYDTYESLGGAAWFQKASEVARLGQSSGGKGWQADQSKYSRTQYIYDLLTPASEPLRQASYLYHFTGLDSLSENTQRAQINALNALEMIGAARKKMDPRNLVVKTFFETKYLEIADLFTTYPDPAVYITLSRIDPTHQGTYEEYRQRRQ